MEGEFLEQLCEGLVLKSSLRAPSLGDRTWGSGQYDPIQEVDGRLATGADAGANAGTGARLSLLALSAIHY